MKINKDDLNEELLNKLKKLETYIESLGSLAVGFSGGVDSSLLFAELTLLVKTVIGITDQTDVIFVNMVFSQK
ncbi:hypothetical protein [Butyrivibrio sp. AE2015]|uniref:hypothetical protein n=1 Tax=Butyrivibrio sp. AE2015 TaxID=1280663 RepID=UPI0003B5EE36|nr:hypothetical protein [Butyrivibrio sp. AE2015]